nr:MAG: capsid protein [Cressdnaviricota sp.]
MTIRNAVSRSRKRRPVRRRRINGRRRVRKSMRRMRKSKSTLSYLRPNTFAKLFYEYENNTVNVPVTTGGNGVFFYMYPMNPAPYTNSIAGNPSAGDVLYTGLDRYCQYYNMARVEAASIRVTATTVNNTSGVVKMALLAIPLRTSGYTIASNVNSIISTYTCPQLFSWPGTKFVQLGLAAGSNNTKTLTMYRKSKTMMGESNIRDDTLSGFSMSSTLSHLVWSYPNDIWYYAVGFYNFGAATATVQVSTRLTGYFNFWGPYVIDQQALT